MSKLPTRDELKKLLDRRGREALLWFAWRNAMRASFALGSRNIKYIWPDDPVKNLYAVLRANVQVYNCLIGRGKVDKDYLRDFADTAQDAADEAVDLPFVAQAAASAAYAYSASEKYILGDVGESVEAYSKAAYSFAAEDVHNFASANADDYKYALVNTYSDIDKANSAYLEHCIADFKYLMDTITPREIGRVNLWWKETPPRIALYEKQLFANLGEMDLDFIGHDIKKLWGGELAIDQMQNYQNTVSETELQTAQDLKRLMVNNEEIQTNYAVRVLLLGPGGAGKTSLSQLIQDGKAERNNMPTLGINYQNHKPVNLLLHEKCFDESTAQKDLKKLQLYLWDFGGQAIFHSLHNAFMHENCIYVLVVDSRHEQAPEEWLYQIAEVTKNKGKVILVTNWFDGINCQQNRLGLMRKFPDLLNENSFFDFSCLTIESTGFKAFMNQMVNDCINSQRQIFKQTQQAIDLVKETYNSDNFITKSQLRMLLCEHFDSDNTDIQELIRRLREFGRFVSVDSRDEELCLKPEWVIDKAYCLLYNERVRKQRGVVTIDDVMDITHLTERDAADGLGRKILDFIEEQQVCIRLDADKKNQLQRFFLPDAAPVDEPVNLAELLERKSAVIVYELPYMPIGLRASLVGNFMVNEAISIDTDSEVWRDGVIVRQPNSINCAIIEYLYRQQRIQLTLVGDDQGVEQLFELINTELESAANKSLKGVSIYGRHKKQHEHKATKVEEEPVKTEIKKNDSGMVRVSHVYNNSVVIDGSTISDTAIGEMAKSHSDNTTVNHSIRVNQEQKQAMSEVIDQLLPVVFKESNSENKITLLKSAADIIENTNEELPQIKDPNVDSFLRTIWSGMKELDATASMAERSAKYIAPAVVKAMEFFAGM